MESPKIGEDGLVFQHDGRRDFVLFGSKGVFLSNDPVSDEDMETFTVTTQDMLTLASLAWSSGCAYFFLIESDSIALIHVGHLSGIRCKRRSWDFLTKFVEAPYFRRRKKSVTNSAS